MDQYRIVERSKNLPDDFSLEICNFLLRKVKMYERRFIEQLEGHSSYSDGNDSQQRKAIIEFKNEIPQCSEGIPQSMKYTLSICLISSRIIRDSVQFIYGRRYAREERVTFARRGSLCVICRDSKSLKQWSELLSVALSSHEGNSMQSHGILLVNGTDLLETYKSDILSSLERHASSLKKGKHKERSRSTEAEGEMDFLQCIECVRLLHAQGMLDNASDKKQSLLCSEAREHCSKCRYFLNTFEFYSSANSEYIDDQCSDHIRLNFPLYRESVISTLERKYMKKEVNTSGTVSQREICFTVLYTFWDCLLVDDPERFCDTDELWSLLNFVASPRDTRIIVSRMKTATDTFSLSSCQGREKVKTMSSFTFQRPEICKSIDKWSSFNMSFQAFLVRTNFSKHVDVIDAKKILRSVKDSKKQKKTYFLQSDREGDYRERCEERQNDNKASSSSSSHSTLAPPTSKRGVKRKRKARSEYTHTKGDFREKDEGMVSRVIPIPRYPSEENIDLYREEEELLNAIATNTLEPAKMIEEFHRLTLSCQFSTSKTVRYMWERFHSSEMRVNEHYARLLWSRVPSRSSALHSREEISSVETDILDLSDQSMFGQRDCTFFTEVERNPKIARLLCTLNCIIRDKLFRCMCDQLSSVGVRSDTDAPCTILVEDNGGLKRNCKRRDVLLLTNALTESSVICALKNNCTDDLQRRSVKTKYENQSSYIGSSRLALINACESFTYELFFDSEKPRQRNIERTVRIYVCSFYSLSRACANYTDRARKTGIGRCFSQPYHHILNVESTAMIGRRSTGEIHKTECNVLFLDCLLPNTELQQRCYESLFLNVNNHFKGFMWHVCQSSLEERLLAYHMRMASILRKDLSSSCLFYDQSQSVFDKNVGAFNECTVYGCGNYVFHDTAREQNSSSPESDDTPNVKRSKSKRSASTSGSSRNKHNIVHLKIAKTYGKINREFMSILLSMKPILNEAKQQHQTVDIGNSVPRYSLSFGSTCLPLETECKGITMYGTGSILRFSYDLLQQYTVDCVSQYEAIKSAFDSKLRLHTAPTLPFLTVVKKKKQTQRPTFPSQATVNSDFRLVRKRKSKFAMARDREASSSHKKEILSFLKAQIDKISLSPSLEECIALDGKLHSLYLKPIITLQYTTQKVQENESLPFRCTVKVRFTRTISLCVNLCADFIFNDFISCTVDSLPVSSRRDEYLSSVPSNFRERDIFKQSVFEEHITPFASSEHTEDSNVQQRLKRDFRLSIVLLSLDFPFVRLRDLNDLQTLKTANKLHRTYTLYFIDSKEGKSNISALIVTLHGAAIIGCFGKDVEQMVCAYLKCVFYSFVARGICNGVQFIHRSLFESRSVKHCLEKLSSQFNLSFSINGKSKFLEERCRLHIGVSGEHVKSTLSQWFSLSLIFKPE